MDENKTIYYYTVDGDTVSKYKVKFNRESMLTFREEIIEKCSVIRPREIVTSSDTLPELENRKNIKLVEVKELDGGTSEYTWKFDEYEFSPLIDWIDRLLLNNPSVLPLLLSDEHPEDVEIARMFDQELVRLHNAYLKLDIGDPDRLKLLREYSNLLHTVEKNRNQKSPFYLFYFVRQSLSPILVAKVPLEEFRHTIKFMGKSLEELSIYGFGLKEVLDEPVETKKI